MVHSYDKPSTKSLKIFMKIPWVMWSPGIHPIYINSVAISIFRLMHGTSAYTSSSHEELMVIDVMVSSVVSSWKGSYTVDPYLFLVSYGIDIR